MPNDRTGVARQVESTATQGLTLLEAVSNGAASHGRGQILPLVEERRRKRG
jgi:hypothetical protein